MTNAMSLRASPDRVVQTIWDDHKMNAQRAKTHGEKPQFGVKRPAYADSDWRPGMDPDYSEHIGPYPWDDVPASGVSSSPPTQTAEIEFTTVATRKQRQPYHAALLRQLHLMASGERIRNLRFALGWTQATAAVRLGI